MSLFDRIFGNGKPIEEPDIRFGRYTDVYHTAEQDMAFDRAVQFFEDEQYIESYQSFFEYLKNEDEGNVKFWKENETLQFELYQGSKKIMGYADHKKLYAKAKVAKAKSLQASFMRRLLEKNFELKYSRFALTPEHEISIVFDTYSTDGSPFKLYAALKELATQADKQDDILLDEFDSLEQADLHVRRELPEWEKEVKYQYIVEQIKSAFDEIDNGKLNTNKYPIAVTYLLLFLCYKLDYLIKPEGYMMEALERIHRVAYEKDGKNAAQKNQGLRKEFQKLLDRPKELFFKEMYEVSATFGITAPVDHQKVVLAIDQELANAKWYREHGYDRIALAIPGFIASRCLFYFAMPKPDKAYFHLLLQTIESDYFKKLGFEAFYENDRLNERLIKRRIREITDKHVDQYPGLAPDLKRLNFKSLAAFAESFCYMVKGLEI
ncbi:MAG: hypothetical protein AAFZ15_00140 [Bacteroidota bacterium]